MSKLSALVTAQPTRSALAAKLHEQLVGMVDLDLCHDLADVLVDDVLVPLATTAEPRRQFTPAHLGVVYLLAEQQGATDVRLRRLWDARSSRQTAPWPWITDSGIRTRRSELVSWGLVEDTGARGESATGRPSRIWSLVGVDPRKLGRTPQPIPGVEDGVRDRLLELLDEAAGDVMVRSQLELVDEFVGIRRAALQAASA